MTLAWPDLSIREVFRHLHAPLCWDFRITRVARMGRPCVSPRCGRTARIGFSPHALRGEIEVSVQKIRGGVGSTSVSNGSLSAAFYHQQIFGEQSTIQPKVPESQGTSWDRTFGSPIAAPGRTRRVDLKAGLMRSTPHSFQSHSKNQAGIRHCAL